MGLSLSESLEESGFDLFWLFFVLEGDLDLEDGDSFVDAFVVEVEDEGALGSVLFALFSAGLKSDVILVWLLSFVGVVVADDADLGGLPLVFLGILPDIYVLLHYFCGVRGYVIFKYYVFAQAIYS